MTAFVIAIDGYAASGKGTLAHKLAQHYQLPYLETGLTYRAVAHALESSAIRLDDEEAAIKIAKNLDFSRLDKTLLSSQAIGEAASRIAVMANLRKVLVEEQIKFAKQPKGAILDGRDIGTVVCPDAAVKLFIVADIEKRAERRFNEMIAQGNKTTYATVLKNLKRRDDRDTNRKDGALKAAHDAHLLDTTKLSIETAFDAAVNLIDPIWKNDSMK